MSLGFDYPDWIRETYDLDTPSMALGGFQSFVELWRGKCRNGAFPAWRDFDFHDFTHWHGWLSVYDVTGRDPFDFHARLWGTELVELLGHDMTGKSPRCGGAGPDAFRGGFGEDDMTFMAKVVNEPCLAVTEGAIFWQNRNYVRYTDLFLPLSSDGQQADGILNATIKLSG